MNEMVERQSNVIGEELSQSNDMFCSLKANTPEEKAKLFRIMNSPEKHLSDCINQTILVTDVFCEGVSLTNKETGEVNICPRIVLVDKDGIGYQSISYGIYSSVKKLFQVYGVPTWETPIPVKVIQVTREKNKILSLTI
jgi:hypothetical protein